MEENKYSVIFTVSVALISAIALRHRICFILPPTYGRQGEKTVADTTLNETQTDRQDPEENQSEPIHLIDFQELLSELRI